MTRGGLIGSVSLLTVLAVVGSGLMAWKYNSLQAAESASAQFAEPAEAIAVAIATERPHRRNTTVIGTVLALQSVTLRNEIAGTVRQVLLTPGKIVEKGDLLVALDVSVEEAELAAHEAQAELARTLLARVQNMSESRVASATELDRARAERDVALAQIARSKAVIARRTILAPFRARVGLADVHPGQYLEEGTLLTTLQGVDDAVHIDFTVPQRFAAGLKPGDTVDVIVTGDEAAAAAIVAIDARVDATTRNATVRAKIAANGDQVPAPGAAVRVRVPISPRQNAVFVPANALRKGPAGDHVFVITSDDKGAKRAKVRPVESGEMLGDDILIRTGLTAGEQVAASGSFKLRDAALVAIVPDAGLSAKPVLSQADLND